MSIVRIGLSETEKYAEGWDAIFGKKKKASSPRKAKASARSASKKGSKSRRKAGKKK